MKLETRRRAPRVVGLTSLIDVIFLLLLFFMLGSTFLDFAELRVSGATGGAGGEAPRALLRIHDDGGLDLNGVAVSAATLVRALHGLDTGEAPVAVLTSAEASVAVLVDVLEALHRAEIPAMLVEPRSGG